MLDDTDLAIIRELKKDGRASFSEIANELGIATSTVSARFEKLKEDGIITGFKPVIDYEKIGFELTALISIKAESNKTRNVAEKLQNHSRVLSFFEVTGETDMMFLTRFIDREDINSFIKELQMMEGIKATDTHMILTPPKLEDNMDIEQILRKKEKSL